MIVICVKSLFNLSPKHQNLSQTRLREKFLTPYFFVKKQAKNFPLFEKSLAKTSLHWICGNNDYLSKNIVRFDPRIPKPTSNLTVRKVFDPLFTKSGGRKTSLHWICGNNDYLSKKIVRFDPRIPKPTSNLTVRKVFDPLFTKSGGQKTSLHGFVEMIVICVKLLFDLTHEYQNPPQT